MSANLSSADHSVVPPRISFSRQYNAAADLIGRNLEAGLADKPAYIDDKGTLSYAELDRRTSRLGSALLKLGLQQEQRVFLCALDTNDWPVAFLGAIRAGIVPVAVNTLLTHKDYAYMLNDSRATVAIVSPDHLPIFLELRDEVPTLQTIIVTGGERHKADLSQVELEGWGVENFEAANTTCDDACFWLYSSGSTGAPKGTVHLQSSMIYTAELFGRQILQISSEDRVFSAAKLFFAYGLGNALSFPLAFGATTVLMAERPTPEAVYKRLIEHKPTVFCGVPTLYAGMLAYPDRPSPEQLSLRISTSAGEALPEELQVRWRDVMGGDIIDGIGSTEMLHVFLSNRIDDIAPGTTGKPVPGYQVKLVDADDNPVAEGEIGDLIIRGPSSAALYWNNREKTRATFQGEWTYSGDKYYVNEQGYYVYAGRSDDMLKVSGIYVSPAEVEATLIKHAAVLEAAVVGASDENDLIKPKAYIVLKDGSQGDETLRKELKNFVKANLAPHKYPRWFVFVDELPKTATGKIQRFKLRELD